MKNDNNKHRKCRQYDQGRLVVNNEGHIQYSEAVPGVSPGLGPVNDRKAISPSVTVEFSGKSVVEVTASACARGSFMYRLIAMSGKGKARRKGELDPVFAGMSQRWLSTPFEPFAFDARGQWYALLTSAVFEIPKQGKYTFSVELARRQCLTGHYAIFDSTVTVRVVEGAQMTLPK
jgi:hypothetical protein